MTVFTPQSTADGSATFFSTEFDEAFHSHFGAYQEAEGKFVGPCRLRERAQQQDTLRILDICYGLGYNSAAALAAIWTVNPIAQIDLIALDISDRPAQDAIAHGLLQHWSEPIPTLLRTLAHRHQVQDSRLQARLLCGDARQTLNIINIGPTNTSQIDVINWQADAIFLDPFSTTKCPQLWTVAFLQRVVSFLKPTGYLATYSCAAAVRSALQQVGLQIGTSPPVGRKAPGTVASWQADTLPPLSLAEQEHLQTRAAVPYRDPDLSATAAEILHQRTQAQAVSELESTGQWKRRWRSRQLSAAPHQAMC